MDETLLGDATLAPLAAALAVNTRLRTLSMHDTRATGGAVGATLLPLLERGAAFAAAHDAALWAALGARLKRSAMAVLAHYVRGNATLRVLDVYYYRNVATPEMEMQRRMNACMCFDAHGRRGSPGSGGTAL